MPRLQGLRRRYGDQSLQAEGAIQFLKDMIPQVEINKWLPCFTKHLNRTLTVQF